MASIPKVPAPGTNANANVRLVEIPGMVPSLTRLPKGCAFAPRCEHAVALCREEYRRCKTGAATMWRRAGARLR